MRRPNGIKQKNFYAVASATSGTEASRRKALSTNAIAKGVIVVPGEGGNVKVKFGSADTVVATTSAYDAYVPQGALLALDFPAGSTHVSFWSDATTAWALVAWDEE